MKFFELTKESQSCAKEALKELINRQSVYELDPFKKLGEVVAAAYIEMERFEGAPDDKKIKIGDAKPIK